MVKTFCAIRRNARNFNCTVPQASPAFPAHLSSRSRVNYAKIFCQLHVARGEFAADKRTLAGFVALCLWNQSFLWPPALSLILAELSPRRIRNVGDLRSADCVYAMWVNELAPPVVVKNLFSLILFVYLFAFMCCFC